MSKDIQTLKAEWFETAKSFPRHDLGALPQDGGPFRLMTEKRGPAFESEDDVNRIIEEKLRAPYVPVVERMAQSLRSDSLKVAGEVLNSIKRCCLLDLCASWPRLLNIAGVTSRGARRFPRQHWVWTDLRDCVELALCYAEHPESLHWQDADATIRGYALVAAEAIESRGPEDYDPEVRAIYAGKAAVYRAFGENR